MAIFLVISDQDAPQLGERIAKLYPGNAHLKVSERAWFVSADKLVKDLSEELGITGGSMGKAFAVGVDNWFGWHSKSIWEWLKQKASK